MPPEWMLKGWRREGGGLKGMYRTRYGAWWGAIKVLSQSQFEFNIFNPPLEIEDHPQGGCFFQRKEKGWFRINFTQRPKGIDEGIQKIETVLEEAFKSRY